MGTGRMDERRKEVVRIALIIELSWRQVTDDLGGGSLPLNRPRRLRRNVIGHAIDPAHLIHNPRRHAIK